MYGDDAWKMMFVAWFIVVALAVLGVVSIIFMIFN